MMNELLWNYQRGGQYLNWDMRLELKNVRSVKRFLV